MANVEEHGAPRANLAETKLTQMGYKQASRSFSILQNEYDCPDISHLGITEVAVNDVDPGSFL